MNNILYNDTYCISLEELNNIYIALLTCADHIYINRGVEIDWQLPPEIYTHIYHSLEVLHENKLIVYWDFPYKKGSSDADLFVDKSQYMQWNDIINGIYFRGDDLHSIYNYLREGNTLLSASEENTSKILLMRREYWTYALLNILPVNNVLIHHPGRLRVSPDRKLESPSPSDKAVQMVFSDTVANLFSLSGEDVVILHKENERFRDLLNKRIGERELFGEEEYDEILKNAVQLAQENYRNDAWGRYDSIRGATVTISAFIANLTPIGPLYNNLTTAINFGKDVKGSLFFTKDANKDFCILLAKYNQKLKRQLNGCYRLDLV